MKTLHRSDPLPMNVPTVVLFDQDATDEIVRVPDELPTEPEPTEPEPTEPEPMCMAVQRVRLWSVARTAIVFWFCIGAVMAGLFLALWAFLTSTGGIDNFQSFVVDVTG